MCRFAPRLEITKINTVEKMSRVCELTGKKAMVGNNVSKALRQPIF